METGAIGGAGVQAQMQVNLLRQSLDMQGQTALQLIQSATQPAPQVQSPEQAPETPVAQPASGVDTYA